MIPVNPRAPKQTKPFRSVMDKLSELEEDAGSKTDEDDSNNNNTRGLCHLVSESGNYPFFPSSWFTTFRYLYHL